MSLTLLATTHRVAPGLLTWKAWDTLRSADRVLAPAGHPLLPYLREAGVRPEEVAEPDPAALVEAARAAQVVWVAAPEGDEALMREIGQIVVDGAGGGGPSPRPGQDPPTVEVLHGSYDLPGARLLDLVSVMDTLRRECPWDAKQTHASLVPYLLEEAYEVADTVEDGDLGALREELGDVLMQVAFHAAVAAERTDETRFTIDDVAGAIVDKLVRRHPHVFGDVTVSGADEVNANWEQIKAAERAAKNGGEASVLDGVPMGQPALTLAAQLQRRAERAGAPPELFDLPEPPAEEQPSVSPGDAGEESALGARLFRLVRESRAQGRDAEAELRAVCRVFRDRVKAWERTRAAE
ncbi:nucleoside triphosphate pyrophosphohydrolase [Actinomadura rubrobrunea]|uniref:Nucleoside triphosphate pyrophosphohydrolase n=1 Tax=Actinomadura rubrobrunea TaxID=115335 RepID=A0A9W6PPE0_9ACTN|nr:MazG family protein [Actinomadura rubrobrunea]GLW62080.1 nucleoside triphosphate pyrophosphohydrolase [Actinomadura rubrobrunea]